MAIETERLRDLVPEILSRLPVKSLMRFQCVQKQWYDLIKSPYFISKHLRTFNKTSSNRVTSSQINEYDNQCAVSLLFFDPETPEFFSYLQNLNFNLVVRPFVFEICGPCNGIYYLHYADYWLNTNMLINPSKREFRVLPELDAALFINLATSGFGFDHKTNDYKVFWTITTYTPLPLRRVFTYTLSTDSWREALTSVPSFWAVPGRSNAFAHGMFHRLAFDDDGDLILAFDMSEEVFRKIRLPEESSSIWTIENFMETIAAIFEPSSTLIMDLWVMKEYGNEESWFKYLKIGSWERISKVFEAWEDDGDNILTKDCDGRMVSSDVKTQEIKSLGVTENGFMPAVLYMESLVSLGGDPMIKQGREHVSLY